MGLKNVSLCRSDAVMPLEFFIGVVGPYGFWSIFVLLISRYDSCTIVLYYMLQDFPCNYIKSGLGLRA